MERFKFNTALAAMMELTNYLGKAKNDGSISQSAWGEAIENLLLMLSPIAPHITEELWEMTGHTYSIHNHPFPTWDNDLAKDQEITLVVQVNGKVRERLEISSETNEEDTKNLVLESPKIIQHTLDKKIKQIIYVPGRLVNIVVE